MNDRLMTNNAAFCHTIQKIRVAFNKRSVALKRANLQGRLHAHIHDLFATIIFFFHTSI